MTKRRARRAPLLFTFFFISLLLISPPFGNDWWSFSTVTERNGHTSISSRYGGSIGLYAPNFGIGVAYASPVTDKRVLNDVDDIDTNSLLDIIMQLPMKRFSSLLSGKWERGLELLELSNHTRYGLFSFLVV